MVGLVATNAKLRGRMISILMEATGLAEQVCRAALAEAGGDLKTALVCLIAGAGVAEARTALDTAGGQVRAALALLGQ